MMKRKAQAAMEFLMTYGWAILVVLAAVGALAYFGVFDTSNLLPEECTVGTGWQCDNEVITTNSVDIRLENNMQTTVDIQSVTFPGTSCTTAANGTVENRGQMSISATCDADEFTSGSREEVDFTVTYQEADETVDRTMSGTVARNVQ